MQKTYRGGVFFTKLGFIMENVHKYRKNALNGLFGNNERFDSFSNRNANNGGNLKKLLL